MSLIDKGKLSYTDNHRINNIVSIENVGDTTNNSFFRKTNQKGKLHKGPIWTAYNKENLGCIPQRVEKALIEDKKCITKVGFNTQSERFFTKAQNCIKTPGPGSYNITKDFDYTVLSSSCYSTKGFGNGFVSKTERFDSRKMFYGRYEPGPGAYMTEGNLTLAHEVAKSLMAKSLYASKATKSLKERKDMPGPGTYDPFVGLGNEDKAKGNHSVFMSTSKRLDLADKRNTPGPGRYFKDDDLCRSVQAQKKMTSQSYFFIQPRQTKEDKLKKFHIKTQQDKADVKFRLVQRKGKLISDRTNTSNDFCSTTKADSCKSLVITKKDLIKLRSKINFDKKQSNESSNDAIGSTYKNLKKEEYLNKELSPHQKKADLFELVSPRWKENQRNFSVPGPAYYCPRILESKLSFNRNSKDFICVSGVSNPLCKETTNQNK